MTRFVPGNSLKRGGVQVNESALLKILKMPAMPASASAAGGIEECPCKLVRKAELTPNL
jgi:hypothetical protein